jgi:hypothetical protein
MAAVSTALHPALLIGFWVPRWTKHRIERPRLTAEDLITLGVVPLSDRRLGARQSSGKVKIAQGNAIRRKTCSPNGINVIVVSGASAPETSTLRPRGRHSPSSWLTRLTSGPIAVKPT